MSTIVESFPVLVRRNGRDVCGMLVRAFEILWCIGAIDGACRMAMSKSRLSRAVRGAVAKLWSINNGAIDGSCIIAMRGKSMECRI